MTPSQTFDSPTQPRLGLALLTYVYLQGLDLLTTVAFLLSGVQEGNPFVRLAMERSPSPLAGLLIVKSIAVALGLYCWLSNRCLLLMRANYGYAALVVWNLMCLVAGLLSRPS